MSQDLYNNPDLQYDSYLSDDVDPFVQQILATTAITSINGITGPTVTFAGGTSGFSFVPGGTTITLLSPITTKGDLYTWETVAGGVRLGVGANGDVLTADSGVTKGIKWAPPATAGTVTGTGTAGRVAFWDSASNITSDADLTFATDTLTVTKLGATTLTGTIAGGGQQLNNIIIGTTTPLAGSFTTVAASGNISSSAGNHLAPDTGGFISTGGQSGMVVRTAGNLDFYNGSALRVTINEVGNLKIAGTADRGTTEGTAQLVIFNGTAPAGTLTNGVSMYSASGKLKSADAAGLIGHVLSVSSVNTVSPTSQNRTLTVDIGGTTYYITAKTTND